MRVRLLLVGALLGLVAACSSTNKTEGCEPATIRACFGPNQCQGTQTCGDDRVFAECVCTGGMAGSAGSGTGGTAGAGTAGAGTGAAAGTGTGGMAGSGAAGGAAGAGGGCVDLLDEVFLPESCWPATAGITDCNPINPNSCGVDMTCDLDLNGDLGCAMDDGTQTEGEACDPMVGPFCLGGLACLMGRCFYPCCSDCDCGGDACIPVNLPNSPGAMLGRCE